MSELLFYILSGIVVGSTFMVLFLRNPIYCALSLVANLLAVAGLFAVLNAHFLAVVQVTVYAGAIMVLVLFVLMLLNVQTEEKRHFSIPWIISGVLIAAIFGLSIFPQMFNSFNVLPSALNGSVKSLGKVLFNEYPLLFELSGFLLLGSMVGAVMLAKKRGANGTN